MLHIHMSFYYCFLFFYQKCEETKIINIQMIDGDVENCIQENIMPRDEQTFM